MSARRVILGLSFLVGTSATSPVELTVYAESG
jgi:hypothetical protein